MSVTLSPIYALFSETLTGLSTIRALRDMQRFQFINMNKLEINQRANFCGMSGNYGWLYYFNGFNFIFLIVLYDHMKISRLQRENEILSISMRDVHENAFVISFLLQLGCSCLNKVWNLIEFYISLLFHQQQWLRHSGWACDYSSLVLLW